MSYPTIDDVARLAGVSVATVSRALRDLPNVAEATRARVLDAAASLDYEIDPRASRLASGRTLTVGVVAPMFGTWYASRVVAGAERVLAAAGYDLLIAAIDEPGHLAPFYARARSFGRRIDGALLVDVFVPADAVRQIDTLGSPAVTVGERLGSFTSLTIDNVTAGDRATQHLIDLGHTRIALVGSAAQRADRSPAPALRLDGFTHALRRRGLDPEPDLIVDADWTVDGGAAAMDHLLGLDEPPTAVFCLSDQMAIGALRRARELGVRVPGDVSLIGFDDHDMSAAFGITTMRQDVDAQGRRAAELLLGAIAGETEVHEESDVELVRRQSTGPAVAETRAETGS